MPHGFQWSLEDYRNAERMAKIQAQALVEAQRKERDRLERESRRTVRRAPSTAPVRATPVRPAPSAFAMELARREAEAENDRAIAKMRAEKAMRATFGSAEYIHNRYGHVVWCGKITEYRNKFSCSESEAVTLIVRDYSESEWAHLEYPLIEAFMGHRK